MRKVQFVAVVLTLALSVPCATLALIGLAYVGDHLGEITSAVTSLLDWRGLAVEGSARWPEVAGMIIGQLLIMSILLIVRRTRRVESQAAAES